ncbi:uncharacterized protein [Amphiura filiformis]|uniref:uncharacterized protein n=1 Tax=Amphiura filiformis TaxID=82378 RepID=UPI003B20D646
MNRKRKTDKPALSFADSSVQGRSADGVNDGDQDDVVGDEERPPRARDKRTMPDWFSDFKVAESGGDVSSEENFVMLPKSTRRSGRNKQEKDEDWQQDENEVLLLDEESEEDIAIDEDDDDDFEPSTSRAAKKPKVNQRKQLQMKRERERLRKEKEQQEEELRLQAQADADLEKALELSRMEAENEARMKQREEEFLAGIHVPEEEEDILNGSTSSQMSGRMANCNSTKNNDMRDDAGALPVSSVTEDSELDVINTVPTRRRPIHRSSQEVEQPGQSTPNHSQELINADLEDATQMTGGDDVVRNSQSPSLFSQEGSIQSNHEMISSTSGVSPSTKPKQQESIIGNLCDRIDPALFRTASRMGLRKRPLEDVQTTYQRRKIPRAVVVPEPPEISTLDEFDFDNEERRRVVTRERRNGNGSGSQVNADGGDRSQRSEKGELSDFWSPPDTYDPGQPLIDTRNQQDKPSLYSPKGTCVKTYTKVILKLLRHYCLRLRKSQTKSALRIERGTPVIQGPYFAGTLRHKKRGAKTPMPVYDLSDDEDEISNNASQDDWKVAVKPTKRLAIKDIVANRKRKRVNVLKDSDSDLDDFQIGNVAKTQRTLHGSELKVQDFDIDVENVNENVPLLALECIATIAGSNRKLNFSQKPCTKSRPDDSPTIAGTSRISDTGVTSGNNENENSSPTLPYDDVYEAETEEFINDENQLGKPSKSGFNEADTVLVKEDSVGNKSKAPSTSGAVVAPSDILVSDKSSTPVMSQEVQNGNEEMIGADRSEKPQQDDPCLVDSTTISVLRKSRKLKRNIDNSQVSHQGAAVTSSENQENMNGVGDENTTKSTARKANPSAHSVSGAETDSKESKVIEDGEELASTSDTKSVNPLSKRTRENVETSSESSREVKPQRESPVGDDVSSMPKNASRW